MAYGMTQARRDPIARLDAWVIEELDALNREEAPAERPKARREPLVEAPELAANDDPLPMDENQFIQRVSEWLSGRPNADLILEEIWRNVVTPAADEGFDDLDDPDDGEPTEARFAAEAGDVEGDAADLAAEAPEGPAGDAADDAAQA